MWPLFLLLSLPSFLLKGEAMSSFHTSTAVSSVTGIQTNLSSRPATSSAGPLLISLTPTPLPTTSHNQDREAKSSFHTSTAVSSVTGIQTNLSNHPATSSAGPLPISLTPTPLPTTSHIQDREATSSFQSSAAVSSVTGLETNMSSRPATSSAGPLLISLTPTPLPTTSHNQDSTYSHHGIQQNVTPSAQRNFSSPSSQPITSSAGPDISSHKFVTKSSQSSLDVSYVIRTTETPGSRLPTIVNTFSTPNSTSAPVTTSVILSRTFVLPTSEPSRKQSPSSVTVTNSLPSVIRTSSEVSTMPSGSAFPPLSYSSTERKITSSPVESTAVGSFTSSTSTWAAPTMSRLVSSSASSVMSSLSSSSLIFNISTATEITITGTASVSPLGSSVVHSSSEAYTAQMTTLATTQNVSSYTYQPVVQPTRSSSASFSVRPSAPLLTSSSGLSTTNGGGESSTTSQLTRHTALLASTSVSVFHSAGNMPTKAVGSEKSTSKKPLIIGLTVGGTLAIAVAVVLVMYWRRKRAAYQYNVFYDEQNIVMNPFDGPK